MIESVLGSKGKGLKMNPIAYLHALWTLLAFSDTDWGADEDSRISVYGFIIYFCGIPIASKSQGMKSVVLSSTEAEYIATPCHRKSQIRLLGKSSNHVNKSAYTKMMYIYEKPFFRSTFVYITSNEVCLSTKDAASTDGCNSDLHAGKRSEGIVSLPLCSLTNWYYRSAINIPIAKPDPAFSCHSELNSELNTSLGTTIRNHDSEPPKSPKSIRSP